MTKTGEDRIADLDEQFYIKGYNLDVDQLVGNELTLNLPMAVLCSDDCKGLCPVCGQNLNIKDCGCDTTYIDPRFESLRSLLKFDEEV